MRPLLLLALVVIGGCAKNPSPPDRPLPPPPDQDVRNLDLDLGSAHWEGRAGRPGRRDVLVVPLTVRNLHRDRTVALDPFTLEVRDRDGRACAVSSGKTLRVRAGDVARVQLRGADCNRREVDRATVRLTGGVEYTFGAQDRVLRVDEQVDVVG